MHISRFSLIALSVCAFAAQDITLEAISIEGSQPATPTSLSDSRTKVSTQNSNTPISTINEALSNQFFVNYKKAGSYNSEPYIRGRGTNGVPIYLEGMRINAAHPDSTNLFNMIDVQEIEVYRGSSGANVGMGALSGAVVVKFKDPKFSTKEEFQASSFLDTKVSLFSNQGYTSAMGTTLYNQYVSFSLSGGISDNENYKTASGNEVPHSDSDSKHYNLSMAIKTGDDSYIYTRYMRDKSSAADPLSRFQQGATWLYTDHPNDDAKTYFLGFKKGEWYGLKDIDVQLFKNTLHYDVNTKKETVVPFATELYRDTETKGAKASAKKEINENHLLSLALNYSKMEVMNGIRQWNTGTGSWTPWTSAPGIKGGDYTNMALQLSDDVKYGKAFFAFALGYENVKRNVISNVNTGALNPHIPPALISLIQKTDTHERDNLFSYNMKAGYEVSPEFIPYVKVSNAERTPYFNEAYGNNPSNGTLVPNQTLENEKVWSVDVGIDGKYDALYYTSALYYQHYKNYIELLKTGYVTTTGGLPIKRYSNLDEAVVYGAELMAGYGFGNDLFVEASYVFTHGQNEDNNTPLAFIAPQKFSLSLAQKRSTGLSWKIEEVLVDNQSRISSVNGEIATPGYALTNASMSYNFSTIGFLKNLILSVELNNIFDKEYREHLDKVSATAWYLPDNSGVNGLMSFKANF